MVDSVTNPVREISLDEARTVKPDAQLEEEIEFQKPTVGLGRIAAQMAKQVIFQKVREAERESVYAEYHKHVGEVVNCVVKRFENGDIIVELGKTEGKLAKARTVETRKLFGRDRIRVIIIKVEKTAKGPQVIVSRTDPALVQHLFQTEVPEIYDGTVQIKSIAREAGERTKIAVSSREKDVDPVGACVGMKGTRVQSIIRELARREDRHHPMESDDIVTFATNSISPAKISRVSIVDSNDKIMEMVVEDSQLSLAIGKKGQNVRLASKLIGWRIDIKSEEEKRAEIESQMEQMQESVPTPLENMPGLTPSFVQKLNAAGIATVEQLADLVAGRSPEHSGNRRKDNRKDQRCAFGVLHAVAVLSGRDGTAALQQHMFSKDEPVVEKQDEAEKQEASPAEGPKAKKAAKRASPKSKIDDILPGPLNRN